jgi:hypothetical protein
MNFSRHGAQERICAGRGFALIQDFQGATLSPVVCHKEIADWQMGRGPEVEVSGILLVPVPLRLHGALIDRAGVPQQCRSSISTESAYAIRTGRCDPSQGNV